MKHLFLNFYYLTSFGKTLLRVSKRNKLDQAVQIDDSGTEYNKFPLVNLWVRRMK